MPEKIIKGIRTSEFILLAKLAYIMRFFLMPHIYLFIFYKIQ